MSCACKWNSNPRLTNYTFWSRPKSSNYHFSKTSMIPPQEIQDSSPIEMALVPKMRNSSAYNTNAWEIYQSHTSSLIQQYQYQPQLRKALICRELLRLINYYNYCWNRFKNWQCYIMKGIGNRCINRRHFVKLSISPLALNPLKETAKFI